MLTSDDIRQALAHYEIGELRTSRPAGHGVINETAFIETSMGRFVIRRNQRRAGSDAVTLRHRLLRWLHQRGFPAPRLLPTSAGATMAVVGERIYEISTFVTGDDFNASRASQLSGVGAILGTYHRAVADFSDPPPPPPPRYLPSSLLGLTERLIARDVMGELTDQLRWYEQRVADLRRQLPDAAYEALPHLLIHGDLHRDNLIFRGDAVAALIDYDQIGVDARVVDIADALVDLAVGAAPPDWSPWGVYRGPLDMDRAQRLLASYSDRAPLSAAERSALPALIEVIWLQGNLRRTLSTADAEPDYHIELLEQGRWLARWMDANRADLRGAGMVY